METSLSRLLPFLDVARKSRRPLALATVLRTAGSTYRKCGAQMLIDYDGDFAGLLSGGCLEGDLHAHACAVIDDGTARTVSYDMRGPDDELWGLGAGCEGAMDILLQRIGPAEDWQPLAAIAEHIERGERVIATTLVRINAGTPSGVIAGTTWLWSGAPPSHTVLATATDPAALADPPMIDSPSIARLRAAARSVAAQLSNGEFTTAVLQDGPMGTLMALPYAPATSLLLLGAGPDARPVAELAQFLGWRVTVYDHRSSLVVAPRFPAGTTLFCGDAAALATHLDPSSFDAVVIMSHHLAADRNYLRALSTSRTHYTGLLGPPPRREKLLADLTPEEAAALRTHLRAPVGLDLGGRSPEAIALGIVADIHAVVHGRVSIRHSAAPIATAPPA